MDKVVVVVVVVMVDVVVVVDVVVMVEMVVVSSAREVQPTLPDSIFSF